MPKQRKTRKANQETHYIKDSTDSPINIKDVKIEFPFKSKSKYKSVESNLKNKTHIIQNDLNPKKQQNKFNSRMAVGKLPQDLWSLNNT